MPDQSQSFEQRYQLFFEQVPGLTYIFMPRRADGSPGSLQLSHQFVEWTGFDLPRHISEHDFIERLIHPDDSEWIRTLNFELVGGGDPVRIEYRMNRADGRPRWVQDQSSLVRDEAGQPLVWMGFVTDITEQREAEQLVATTLARLEASNRDLAEALARQEATTRALERLSSAKSDFVSRISHEFRTPLTSIQGYSELIQTEAETLEEARAFAATINQSAVRLARMVNDVLDLDRLESGQHHLILTSVDLNAVVSDAVVDLRPTASKHDLGLDLASVLPVIRADQDSLLQVVINLLSNAIKYAPAGGRITVTTIAHANAVELTVSDHGIGIPDAYRRSVFERYGRIPRPEQVGIAGTGLGLPIARNIVELHDGKIWVEPNTPTGSTFHVLLPIDGATSD